jgi:crotonobetainyl-CoA:carnitine CoA-transferase CaiB-like acyl-CoA transferase
MSTPLAGLRVLDASRVLAGPFCGQTLADLGADVVKLERPGSGDDTRAWGPPFHPSGLSAYFLSCNRNKRSIAVDLSTGTGLSTFHELLDNCDILIENFRTDSTAHLGLESSQILARHPKLIACSISGYGRTGPQRDVPGYDFAIQALSGLMAITGPADGSPSKVGVAITDVVTGLYAAIGILACVRAREQSGHGYTIDLSLLDCAVAAQVNVAQAYLTSGVVPRRQGNAHLQIVPYQSFPTADGWLVLNVGNDGQWQHFCDAAGRDDLKREVRFGTNPLRVRHREILVPMLEELMRTRTTADWAERLRDANVPHADIRTYDAVFGDEQLLQRGMKVTIADPAGNPVDLLGSPFQISGIEPVLPKMPPLLGADTEAVLRDWLRRE